MLSIRIIAGCGAHRKYRTVMVSIAAGYRTPLTLLREHRYSRGYGFHTSSTFHSGSIRPDNQQHGGAMGGTVADKPLTIGEAIRKHWPEYLMEASGLETFMVSAGLITTL